MTGEGVAAIITATFAGVLGLLSFWRGYRKDRLLRGQPTPTPPEIEAGMRAVEAYKSLMGDIEEDRARMRLERDHEHEMRIVAEDEVVELRRQLARYELPGGHDRHSGDG